MSMLIYISFVCICVCVCVMIVCQFARISTGGARARALSDSESQCAPNVCTAVRVVVAMATRRLFGLLAAKELK